MKVIWNDKIVDRAEVKIDLEDRGYQFGDGVYEVIRAYNGIFFSLDEHVDRLFSSAAKIELTIPYSKEEIKTLAVDLLKESKVVTGNLYMQMTRGIASPRNHLYPSASVRPMLTGSMTAVERDAEKMEAGIPTIVEKDIRWLRCDIKMISLLGNIMLKHEAHKKDAEEAILERDGLITECSSSNLAIVKDGEIYTHPDGNLILPGITKMIWLKCADELGITVNETPFTVEDLFNADEVFCSSTTKEVMPISKINEQEFAVQDYTVVRDLQERFKQKIIQKCGTLS